MENRVKEFCSKYKTKKEADEFNSKLSATTGIGSYPFYNDYKDSFRFELVAFETSRHFHIGYHRGTSLITLDEEDLEYLYNKYSQQVNKELESKIKELRDEYKDF